MFIKLDEVFINYCISYFYNIIDSILPSGCYKINCRCCFDYFCNYNFKEDILEVTYVASFYISKKM